MRSGACFSILCSILFVIVHISVCHIQQKPFTFVIHGVQNCSNFSVKIVTARLNIVRQQAVNRNSKRVGNIHQSFKTGLSFAPLDLPNKIDALLCFLSQIL